MRENSSRMRSHDTTVISGAIAVSASQVGGSISKGPVAANRTARSIRSLSSRNRARGSPMARSTRASRSARPPTKSTTSRVSGSMNSPLTVKSRRTASMRAVVNRTPVGRRPSM